MMEVSRDTVSESGLSRDGPIDSSGYETEAVLHISPTCQKAFEITDLSAGRLHRITRPAPRFISSVTRSGSSVILSTSSVTHQSLRHDRMFLQIFSLSLS